MAEKDRSIMINFEEELKNFKPSLEVEEAEQAIYNHELTDMTDVLADKMKESILSNIPLKRFGQPEEIAETAVFLAKSKYITGQVIRVDGGMVIG